MSRRVTRIAAALVLLGAPGSGAQDLAAQDVRESADAARDACVAAARAGNETDARNAADRAQALFRELAAHPGHEPDGLTGQGSVISQCRIPFAGMMRQGELVMESIDLAERALAIDSLHLGARFLLAMNFRGMPAFLGRARDAEFQFERIIELHGDRADADAVRLTYVLLGDIYLRDGRRAEALALWRRGLERWPADTALRERLERNGEQLDAASGATAAQPSARAGPRPAPRYALAPIVVEAGGVSLEDPRSATRLTKLDVYTAPGGTADVLQVFQTMPGVTRVNDGSDLYVRGGDAAESPVFVDGARLFQAGMFESLNGSVFGVLDPAVLKRAYFSSGGFSVRYGNALSGVLDVETEGRPPVRTWRAGANLATAGGTLRLPVGRRGGAWASASGTDASALVWLQRRGAEYAVSPQAVKALGGIIFEPARGIEVRATTLLEHDRVEVMADANGWRGPFRGTGGSRLGGLTLHALPSDGRSAVRASLSWSERVTGFGFGVLDRDRRDRFVGLRAESDRAMRDDLTVRFGLEAARLSFNEDGMVPEIEAVAPGSPYRDLAAEDDSHHAGGFVEAEQTLRPGLAMIAGARVDRLPGEAGWTADPRLALAWRSGDWTFRTGAGIFHQGRWRVRYQVPDAGRPSGVPTGARHFVAGLQHDGALVLRAEAYHKDWTGYVDDGGRGPRIESGYANGLDVLTRWRSDRHQGWLTWSWLRGAVVLEDGRTVPYATSVTHSVTAVGRREIAQRWEIGATVRHATGRPYTPIVGADEQGAPRFGATHAERLPEYLRLDVRLTHLRPVAGGVWVLYLEGLNLLDRRNVMGYVWDAGYRERRAIFSFFSRRTLVLGVEAQF